MSKVQRAIDFAKYENAVEKLTVFLQERLGGLAIRSAIFFGSSTIRENGERGEVSFIYTSSRSYKVPGTQISLGALKVYPMSPFFTVEISKKIITDVFENIEEYKLKLTSNYDDLSYIADEMVYREHKQEIA